MRPITFGLVLPAGSPTREWRATFVADVNRALRLVAGHFDSAWMIDHLQDGADTPARSAARAAGQAVATAHVPRHAYGSAVYAQQAIYRAAEPAEAEAAAAKERDWQYTHLLQLRETKQTIG